jgi:hypothetical protein
MSQDKHEQDFEEYLQGDSALSARYQQSSSEQTPPGHLDDAILAASRREVKAKPGYVSSPFSSNWQKPLSLAAVVVLSVTVIVTLQYDHNDIHLTKPALQQASPQLEESTDNVSSDRMDNDAQIEDFRVNEMEVMSDMAVEADFAEDASFVAPPAALKREKNMAGKSANIVSEEKAISASRQRLELMSDMPAAPRALEKSFVGVSQGLAESIQKDQVNSPTKKAMSAKPKMKSQVAEFAEKRNIDVKPDTFGTVANESLAIPTPTLLKESSMDASLAVAADSVMLNADAAQWLSQIKQLWHSGEEQAALSQLRLFREENPNYNENKMLEVLAPKLVEMSKTQH